MPMGLGATELMIILLVGVVFFGTKRLPKIAKSLGEGIREFRNVGKEISSGFDDEAGTKK